jgi:mono/diheme cytochrome c family protein
MKNIIAFLSFVVLVFIMALYGCSGDSGTSKPNAKAIPGMSTFKNYCTACHGADGKMGLNGAANLTLTTLSKEETVAVITNGRKMMAPYKSILSEQEINDVADYVLTLKE